jgi:Lon protease-like protein
MKDLPLFPLNTVLFPGGRLPLRIFEQRYMEMAKACLRGEAPFGVCLIREGREVGTPATPHAIGCLARIVEWDMEQLGVLQISARGERRFRVLEQHVQPDGLVRAAVELLAEEGDVDSVVPPACLPCAKLLERLIDRQPALFEPPPHPLDSSAWVSARLSEILPLPLPVKQELLEIEQGSVRLERLNRLISQEADRAES